MKKPVNYSTEQITTAKRDFIHDLVFDLASDGSFTFECDLCSSEKVEAPYADSVVYERTGERLSVLCFLGRQWVLWGRACALLGQQRQFLNYRIINNHDQVEILRLDAGSAANLSDFVGKGIFASAKAPRARCKTIFFDYSALGDLRRNATSRNKLRARSSTTPQRTKRPASSDDEDGESDNDADETDEDAAATQSAKRVRTARRYADAGEDEDDADGSSDDEPLSQSGTESQDAGELTSPVLKASAAPTRRLPHSELHAVSRVVVSTRAGSSGDEGSGRSRSRSRTPLWITMLEETIVTRMQPRTFPELSILAAVAPKAPASPSVRRKPLHVHRAVRADADMGEGSLTAC